MRAGRGFTLLELLIGLTILGFISLMIVGSLRFGTHAWQRARSVEQVAGEDELIRRFIRTALASAYPRWDVSNPTGGYVDFQGDSQSIAFLAPAPQSLGGAGLARYVIRVIKGEDKRVTLTIAARRELASDSSPERPASVAIDGAVDGAFAYYGTTDPSQSASWRDHWVNERALPLLVRIGIVFPANNIRQWPDLIVAPRATEDVNCVYDWPSKSCQGR